MNCLLRELSTGEFPGAGSNICTIFKTELFKQLLPQSTCQYKVKMGVLSRLRHKPSFLFSKYFSASQVQMVSLPPSGASAPPTPGSRYRFSCPTVSNCESRFKYINPHHVPPPLPHVPVDNKAAVWTNQVVLSLCKVLINSDSMVGGRFLVKTLQITSIAQFHTSEKVFSPNSDALQHCNSCQYIPIIEKDQAEMRKPS